MDLIGPPRPAIQVVYQAGSGAEEAAAMGLKTRRASACGILVFQRQVDRHFGPMRLRVRAAFNLDPASVALHELLRDK
jgi:hypothetical protein